MEQFANNIATTLNNGGSVNNSSNPVTFTVTSATGFPTTGNFRIIIDDEIMIVTSVSGNNFTATRAAESTTIATHVDGSIVTHVLTVGSLYQLLQDNGRNPIPKGLGLKWLSTTTLTLKAGDVLDKTGNRQLFLAADVTLNTATTGANGIDRKTLTGTVATTDTVATVTGTGTAFLTEFGTRDGTGTITGAGTTITGTSTLFLEELFVGDMIGTPSVGYSRITAIASNTSLTIVAALPGGSPGGAAYKIIEQPTYSSHTGTSHIVSTIASNTSLTISPLSGYTESGVTAYAGVLTKQTALNIWVVNGTTGTVGLLSTQRTTVFGQSGYTDYSRRVGVWGLNASSQLYYMTQSGPGNRRKYLYHEALSFTNSQLLSAGGATTWTTVATIPPPDLVPPTAQELILSIYLGTPSTTINIYWRPRGFGSSTVNRNSFISCVTSGVANGMIETPHDGANAIDYGLSASSGTPANIWLSGYIENY